MLQFNVTSFSEEGCMVPAILIGQLGKNFTDGNNTLISGDELLKWQLIGSMIFSMNLEENSHM